MLKKFYLENYLNNKFIEAEEKEIILNEAIQGDISKHTLMQLFSSDNIKYLNQFLPQDQKAAEKQRMDILYQAMTDRQNFLKKDFEKDFFVQKNKLQELFNKKKIEKVYFTKDFEDVIVNHCAVKQAWEKTLEKGEKSWWDSSDENGGKKYLKNDYVVSIKDKKATRKYKVNLYLKEMVKRIEGEIGSEHGSDLSFPRVDPYHYSYKGKEYKEKKRFNGMLLPEDETIGMNYDKWLTASAQGLLSPKSLKHGEEIEVEGESEFLPGHTGAVKKKINFIKHEKLKNKNMLDVEKVLLRKEIRRIFEGSELTKDIIRSYGKPKRGSDASSATTQPKEPDRYKDLLNDFIYKLFNLEHLSFLKKLEPLRNIEDPEGFLKELIKLSKDEEKLSVKFLRYAKESTDEKEESEESVKKTENEAIKLYKQMEKAVNDEGIIHIFDNESYKKSFINLIIFKQLIHWIKEGNFKIKNPITGTDELAKIENDEIVFPNLYQPTFKKNITYYKDVRGKSGIEEKRFQEEGVDMPVLLPGSILIEKERDEVSEPVESLKKPKIGEEIWNPHEKRYEQRYYDLKQHYLNKQASGLLTGGDLIGIQGSADKIFGGMHPNRMIESFKFLCPDPDDKKKDEIFWNKINDFIRKNGQLALAHFDPVGGPGGLPKVDYEAIPPSVTDKEMQGSYKGDPYKFIVVKKLAEIIWDKILGYRYIDSHDIKPEKLRLMSNFPELYHLIFSKVFSNLGDNDMFESEGLKSFIQEKVQNYLDKKVSSREARGSRSGNISQDIGEMKPEELKEPEDPEYKEKEKRNLETLQKITSRELATKNVQAWVEALNRNFLHLCKEGRSKKVCGVCKDAIEDKCSIVVDQLVLREILEKSIRAADEADKIRNIRPSEPSVSPVPKTKPAPVVTSIPKPTVSPITPASPLVPSVSSAPSAPSAPFAPPSAPSAPPSAPSAPPSAPSAPPSAPPSALPSVIPSTPSAPPSAPPKISTEPVAPVVKNLDHHAMEMVFERTNAMVQYLEPIILAHYANLDLEAQQEKERKEIEAYRDFINKKEQTLLDTKLNAKEKEEIYKEIALAKDQILKNISKEYKDLLKEFNKNKLEVIKKLTDYFRFVSHKESLKDALLAKLQMQGIDIEDHLSAEDLNKYGLA